MNYLLKYIFIVIILFIAIQIYNKYNCNTYYNKLQEK